MMKRGSAMKNNMLVVNEKTCDICKSSTGVDEESTLLFGEWMHASNITVHYFCLLLSTNLPQNGEVCSGILGFCLKDIRREIAAAANRICCYCNDPNAAVSCRVCKDYFHLVCGKVRNCLHEFHDQFLSICDNCISYDEIRKNPKTSEVICYICKRQMAGYNPVEWIHAGSCCGNGYVHRICMLRYASSAGYYLKCIWCKNPEFRNYVRTRGIFVPDRDASWEREANAFGGLHRGHQHCDMDVCVCPKGRDYITKTKNGKWNLILCQLCGSFGAHNPKCLPGKAQSNTAVEKFKCNTCIECSQQSADGGGLYVTKLDDGDDNINDDDDDPISGQDSNAESQPRQVMKESDEMHKTDANSADDNDACIEIEKDNTMQLQANNTHYECSQQSADGGGLYVTKLDDGDDNINDDDDDPISEQDSLITVVDLCTPEILTKSNAESQSRQVMEASDMMQKLNANFADHNDDTQATGEQALFGNGSSTQQETNNFNISIELEEHLVFDDDADDDGTTSNSLMPTIRNITTSISQEFSDINLQQSPVITSTTEENWVTFETYEIVNYDCIGMCTVRINLESPRYVGRTLREIQETEIFTGEDIVERRLGERGIFDDIDRILERGFP